VQQSRDRKGFGHEDTKTQKNAREVPDYFTIFVPLRLRGKTRIQ